MLSQLPVCSTLSFIYLMCYTMPLLSWRLRGNVGRLHTCKRSKRPGMLHLESSICNTKTGCYVLWPWCPCVCIKAAAWISSLRQQSSWCDLHYYGIPDCSLWMDGGWDVSSLTMCVVLLLLCDSNLWWGQRLLSTAEKFYKDMMKLLGETLIVTGSLNSDVLPACPEGVLTNMFGLCRTRR